MITLLCGDALEELRKLPDGAFGTILADPPWSFRHKSGSAAPDCPKHFRYHTLESEDILALPVENLALPQAHLYLWTTDAHLEIALQVMRAWGFEYIQVLCWLKTDRGCIHKVHMGMGNHFRHCFELCLYGIRGGLRIKTKATLAAFTAPIGKHSAKPELLYDMIEANSPGPYLELFARNQRSGWTTWGNEAASETLWARMA